ncbi:MAG TPA: polyphosphate kinase, partial [Deltaproteobacteria bacterium]|nr:polyphosphate kinase [Deltaproteobacteria bacterium]
KFWPKYQQAFEEMLQATSRPEAPWYVIPADNKWYRNFIVGGIIVKTLEEMNLKYPREAPGVDFSKIKIK